MITIPTLNISVLQPYITYQTYYFDQNVFDKSYWFHWLDYEAPQLRDIRNLYSLSLSMNHSFEYRMQKTNMSCCYNGLINKVMYPSSMLRRFVSLLLVAIRIPLWYSPDDILWHIVILAYFLDVSTDSFYEY